MEVVCIKKLISIVISAIIIALTPFVAIRYRDIHLSGKFCAAFFKKDIDTVNDLINKNWNVNTYSNLGLIPFPEFNARYLPLNQACMFSNSDVVEKLLKRGADPNKKGTYDNPAYCAVQGARPNGFPDTKIKIELLINYGMDLSLAKVRYQPVSELLHELSFKISEKDKEIAVEILKIMLDNGAVYDVEDLRRALIKADMAWAFEYLMEGRTPTNG